MAQCRSLVVHTRYHPVTDFGPRVALMSASCVGGSNPSYCEMAGFANGDFCYTRTEGGDLQMFACDAMAVGRALDTGRWGPTWYYNGKPCDAVGDATPGCRNHPDNQFLVIAKGPGEYAACANPSVPIVGDRCGTFTIP